MHRRNLWILLLICLVTVCMGDLGYVTYRQGKQRVLQDMQQALLDANAVDYEERLLKDGAVLPKPLGRKVKGCRICVEDHIEEIVFEDSLEERVADRLVNQYMLARFNPIVPDKYGALFAEKLKEKGITDRSGIIYSHNGVSQYSDNDSISPRLALQTSVMMLDVKNTVAVQGWVDSRWNTIWSRMDTARLWNVVVCYLIALVVLLSRWKRDKSIKRVENDAYCEVGKIKLDFKYQCLYVDGVERSITNVDFKLLLMFLRAPDFYVSRSDIQQTFWPTSTSANDNINTHIRLLRETLKDLDGYTLATIKGKGYRLEIVQSFGGNLLKNWIKKAC